MAFDRFKPEKSSLSARSKALRSGRPGNGLRKTSETLLEDLRLHRSSEGTYWVSFSFRSAFLAKLHVSFCHGIPKCKMVASIDASSMTEFTPEALWKKKHRQQQAFKNLNIANLKEDTALVEFSLNPRILLQVDLPSGLWIQAKGCHGRMHCGCSDAVDWILLSPGDLGQAKGFGVKELREVRCSGKEPKRMIFSLQVGQPHINALETMHGAFTMLLLDVLTTITIMDFSPKPTVSVNMAGQYQGAAKLGDELSLDCRVEKAGKSLVYTSMTIKSGDKTVFTGQHTKMFNRYVFLHRFYVSNLEAPYEVLGLSPELCFHFLGASGVPWQTDVQEGCETLQFVSGMMLKDQDTLMLSVGVSDCESSFVSLHLATVLELLHPPQPPQKLPKHVAAAGARADRGGPVASALRALRLLKAMAKPMALPGEATRKDVPEALRAQHRLEHLWQKRLAERSRACQEAIDCPEKHLLGKAQLMSESP
ncbi:Acyl-coenzyme A thioesterase 13 (Acyl-CoA thioesterase 13) (Hotdog-fold thioesterase superfamily member 2) (Palmitoyl-CoA hydrolase) (Thioesterase superfamily member 2) (THEM2) [Durusdinium trenchii]|uniref:Acyl-coenzyme A thioesterase 13 (Acyl-CoA thioesterase 13) (Hotdog-fold thioesterase superfamily member 2) (Palmitoyl-CoA hydrolase) (Thioesterase superfamily member 2) (THEM2) n=1 Tax=Durusdinium trenchii TaxID=1381693 RepID=A0ABP0JDT8_9DINO